jgi:transposase-like protein
MAGKRKQQSPELKFKSVLVSLQRDRTIEEVCRKYEVSSVDPWCQALQQRESEEFGDQCDPKSQGAGI